MTDLSQLSDAELVTLCVARSSKDDRPFAEIFHRHHRFVARVVYRYFPREQDVEDLTQEIFLKAYRSLRQFAGKASLKTWLFSIAVNTAKNELRNRSRRPDVVEQSLTEMEERLQSRVEDQPQHVLRQQQNFMGMFSRLSRQEQQILLLKDGNELTYDEISAQMNISVSAAKMRVQRARLAIKKIVQEQDHER